MKKLVPAFLTCASLALVSLTAQPAVADVSQSVATLMEQLRNREPIDPDLVKAVPPQQLLPEIQKYLGDASPYVRMYSLNWLVSIASSSRDLATRQEAVELALTGVEQEPLYPLANNVTSHMVSLPPSAFSQEAKDIINRMMSRDKVSSDIVRLAGLANVQTPAVKQRLQKMLAASAERNKTKLDAKGQPIPSSRREQSNHISSDAAVWAMAAMGNDAAIQSLIAELDNAPDAVARLAPLQLLADTRQPRAVAALVRYLFSEECLPNTIDEFVPGPASKLPGPKLAHRVVGLLANIIEDWPAETLKKSGSEESLTLARQWVTRRGIANLKIKR